MGKRVLLLLSLFLPLLLSGAGKDVSVTVASQADFDVLSARITKSAKEGAQSIDVTFREGIYFYRDNQLDIRGLNAPSLRISLHCSGAVFIGASEGERSEYDTFVRLSDLTCRERLSAPVQAQGRPELVDRKSGLCRVKTKEKDVPAAKADGLFLILTQWYRSEKYPVQRIQGGYVYFVCPDYASDGNPFHDPDSDYKFGKVLPRYELLDARSEPAGCHRSTASRFLTLHGCYIGTFTLTGARFVGNGGRDCLMQFYADDAVSVEVSNCRFEFIHGDVVHVQRTSNFRFADNVLEHLWMHGVTVDYFASGAEFTGNRFRDTGILMDQTFCIQLRGSNFHVHGNVFKDFTYGAIGIGTFYRESVPASASGVVEENDLSCSSGFTRYLMDSGAIYTWTINRNVVIRKNHVHDIGGYKDNRGIFCDDGTVNVHILENRVERIANSYCIDLRRVSRVAKDPQSYAKKVNVGNRLEGNVVDGKVRFENDDE